MLAGYLPAKKQKLKKIVTIELSLNDPAPFFLSMLILN